MIVGKVQIQNGWFFIGIGTDRVKNLKVSDIFVFAQKEDINSFDSDYWESFEMTPVKGDCNFAPGTDDGFLVKKGTSELSEFAPGEDTGIMALQDMKKVRRLLVTTIRWLLSIGHLPTITPVDDRRLKAVYRIVKEFDYTIRYEDEVTIIIKGEGE